MYTLLIDVVMGTITDAIEEQAEKGLGRDADSSYSSDSSGSANEPLPYPLSATFTSIPSLQESTPSSSDLTTDLTTPNPLPSPGTDPEQGKEKEQWYRFEVINHSIGEIKVQDVLIAHAAKGYIFTYNVGINIEAAAQAQVSYYLVPSLYFTSVCAYYLYTYTTCMHKLLLNIHCI